jgi:exosortase
MDTPLESSEGLLARPSRAWLSLSIHTWIKIGIIGAAFLGVFHAELARVVGRWTSDPSWSHGFLIPLFSLYFLNQRKEDLLALTPRPSVLGLLSLCAAIAFYLFNVVSPSGYAYFRALSIVAAMASIGLLLGGWRVMRFVGLPVFYLLFAIPLPQRYYVAITMPMRELAATIAAALLNLSRTVETTVTGVIIDIVYQGKPLEPSLNVAEACSGMRLLMAFLALGVAMAYLHPRPFWQRGMLLLSAIPIAICCNVIRVTATGFIYVFVHPKYTHGLYHDLLGIAMLPLAFGLHGALAWFMASLFIEEGPSGEQVLIIQRRGPKTV